MIDWLKKYHKWISIVFALFIVLFALSGIVLNHRELLSSVDVNRNILPDEYRYNNWNDAAVKSTLRISNDSVLIYGNIGIWLTDTTFGSFKDFNAGFPEGIDNRKICSMFMTQKGEILAGTFFGLYHYDRNTKKWVFVNLPVNEKRITDLMELNGTLYVMTRSFLLTTTDLKTFRQINIPPPENYDNKIGLFKTLWVIHSGEIYGEIGKIIVDFAALIFIFLTVTGVILFINGYRMKSRVSKDKKIYKIYKNSIWNLKWHNKIGWTTVLLLILTTSTGMFLRPPLLAIIGNSRVDKIPHTELATPNPWFDILRRIAYDKENNRFIVATMDGFFYSDDYFSTEMKMFPYQPPASIMGVNVMKQTGKDTWLIGSFEGLFIWNTRTGYIWDYIKKQPYIPPEPGGPPIGDFKVTGFTNDFMGQEVFFDYDYGALNLTSEIPFTPMPDNVKKASPISLWNVALEVHTARIYQALIGPFYILIVPLSGLAVLFILISGFFVWYKRHRKAKYVPEIIEKVNNNKLNNKIMKHKKYSVSEECISCRACVEVAGNNFSMNDENKAFVFKQPETNEEEIECHSALEVCPVNAISAIEKEDVSPDTMPVLAKSNIKETLDKYPELKDILVKLSPKFKKMQNPALYNTLARFASFKDAARVTGLSLCEILHTINKHLGVEEKLLNSMPECIKDGGKDDELKGTEISWKESSDRYIYNPDTMSELIEKVSKLGPQENMVFISVEYPSELLKVVEGLGFKFNVEKNREYRVSVFNPENEEPAEDWMERRHNFDVLDVRMMMTDPFDIIIKKAYEVEEDDGFILIQRFEPYPMINMLSEMGFEHYTEYMGPEEIWIYFHKIKTDDDGEDGGAEKPEVVIQSATPVAYPVIMRLLQSDVIRKAVKVKELKVWEETEKHLAWIANGKADISFSALITSAKLRNSDVKIPAMFVWDNFVILTRGYKAESFEDLKGKTIHTPLFEEAPPAKITKYLIKASGLNPDDFNFVYGEPFGRPEKIYADFITGTADTVILREPEASYAIKIMQDRGEEISIISYNKIWNEQNPGFGSFPNAGVVLKGEFVRNYPEITEVFLEELKKAIDWVNENRDEAANLSFDMMRQPPDRVRLFLDRVNFNYVSGEELVNKVKAYFDILTAEGIVEAEVDDEFLSVFKM
ncbi:MAG: DUF1858 domain-containing protein [Chlorobi bacterium]|nr:DUF1858 domain-containing protein [Chlorobiota bacterium]